MTQLDHNKEVKEYFRDTQLEYIHIYGAKKHYAIHYPYWDNTTRNMQEALLRMNWKIADIVKVKRDEKILDAGCGVGGSSIWLAKEIGAKVNGITLGNFYVNRANKNAKKEKITESVKFSEQDYLNTNFLENYFDVIWGLESICYAYDKRLFLEEAKRVLKPKGRIIITDYILFKDPKIMEKDEILMVKKFCKGWMIPNLILYPKFTNDMKELGFTKIKFHDFLPNVWKFSRNIYLRAILQIPLYTVAKQFGLRKDLHLSHIWSTYYQFLLVKMNVGRYGAISAIKG